MDRPRHFYVYALLRENGEPFYIGKGQGKRWGNHETAARAGKPGYRFNIIRAMLARGFELPKIKIHEDLPESLALEYEIALIAAIGRHPHGPLANLTDGGDGATGYRAPPHIREKFSEAHRGKPWSEARRAANKRVRLARPPKTKEKASWSSGTWQRRPTVDDALGELVGNY